MNPVSTMAKLLISMGVLILVAGVILLLMSKINPGSFRLPGDIYIKRDGFSFYFPIVTCLLISIILSILLNLFGRR